MSKKKLILIIMDGWGIAKNPEVSAIDQGNTPFYDKCIREYPHSRLMASEEAVGLPAGQMGNSEVGHTNIGAGRVVYQDLVRISQALKTREFAENPEFRNLVNYCKENQKPLHLLGLFSDGGVHSHIEHLKGILRILAEEKEMPPVYLHLFTDGRDTDPRGGIEYVRDLEAFLKQEKVGKIASIIGRYYSMDRNNKWDRIAKAYDLLVRGEGQRFPNAEAALASAYADGVTDEFVLPAVIAEGSNPPATLQEGDGLLFFNFRTDRGRQLSIALTQKDFPEENMEKLNLHYCTMTRYDDTFKGIKVLFEKDNIRNGLGETLAEMGKTQVRIAETEKYPHVTFFFNGGQEEPFPGEKRILCPSPKVATYDMQPQMSAFEIRDKIIAEMQENGPDFICLNFANPDMVGHTGVFEAAVKACETVDQCTREVAEAAHKQGYHVLITADHGNADYMINPDGSPNTAHSTALVPFILISADGQPRKLEDGRLGDIAPTILRLMGLNLPEAMTGSVLVSEENLIQK